MKEEFDMQAAREICTNCQSRMDDVDHDYWNAHAASVLPAALDRIVEQERGISNLQTALVARDQMIAAQAKRIAELEGMLAEPEARSLLNFQRFEARRDARRGLKAEGKL